MRFPATDAHSHHGTTCFTQKHASKGSVPIAHTPPTQTFSTNSTGHVLQRLHIVNLQGDMHTEFYTLHAQVAATPDMIQNIFPFVLRWERQQHWWNEHERRNTASGVWGRKTSGNNRHCSSTRYYASRGGWAGHVLTYGHTTCTNSTQNRVLSQRTTQCFL